MGIAAICTVQAWMYTTAASLTSDGLGDGVGRSLCGHCRPGHCRPDGSDPHRALCLDVFTALRACAGFAGAGVWGEASMMA